MATKGFIGALKQAAGRDGETLPQFSTEYKKLTAQDKKELYEMLIAAGYDCNPPQG